MIASWGVVRVGLETGVGYTDARNEATHRFVEQLRELKIHFPHI